MVPIKPIRFFVGFQSAPTEGRRSRVHERLASRDRREHPCGPWHGLESVINPQESTQEPPLNWVDFIQHKGGRRSLKPE